MLVVVANDLPPAVRGRMKLWFTEPRPNVFVSGVKDSVAETVVSYLYKHCPPEAGVMFFRSINRPPGFELKSIGPTKKRQTQICGLPLVIEAQQND
ncbi:type I-E CRISPR-associated endoribonuclease Cas2e [Endozoicomonas atrinae]|uniref:type I-E CRISPR-associated endoribonuclease Cas2e n=1 Tax=Endozoicomonas atrinae TaxID=1333660 RepID=UPI003AFFB41B